MPDYRTPLEKEVHDLMAELQICLATPKLGRERFHRLLGHLRNAKVHLDNKQYGCASGRHASACTCR